MSSSPDPSRPGPWERRVVAAGVALMAAAGALIVVLVAIAGIGVLVTDGADSSDALLYAGAAVLTPVAAFAGARGAQIAFEYARGSHTRGRQVALWTLAAWLTWFAWGIPVSGGWLSLVLVLYTGLVLPVVLLVVLVSLLVRSGRGRWVALIPVVGAVVAVGFIALRPVPVLGNDGDALAYSVSREFDGDVMVDTCDKVSRGWQCFVRGDGGSGGRAYYVFLQSGGCWKAYSPEVRERGPVQGSACVSLRDYLRIGARLS